MYICTMKELQNILLSDMPLLISTDGYRRLMVEAFPITPSSFLFQPKSYQDKVKEVVQQFPEELHLTVDFSSPELQEGSVAYHRVWGVVTAESRWMFSSKQLEKDLLAAEQNPQITSHLLHINSPGGEAYYLDRLSETLRQLEKPVITLYEMACSAAYYIGCHGQKVYATTLFDFAGCIGTMTSFYDSQPYYEKLGIKLVEAKADGSDLKNKMFDDLRKGKAEQYIKEVLNPMNDAFLQEVRQQRKKLAALPDDAPVLRGETFFTAAAEEIGLCDGQRTLEQAAQECAELGRRWSETTRKKQAVYNAI